MKTFDVYPLFDIEPVKAEGCFLYDKEHKKYLDFYGGHGVISVGHNHKKWKAHITEQLSKVPFYSNSVKNSLQGKLAEKLGELSGYPHYNLFIVNSGAEAVENALKLASVHTNRKKILSFRGGFHGRTAAALSVTDYPSMKADIHESSHVEFIHINDEVQLKEKLNSKQFCAVIIEGIQGVGGVDRPSNEFLRALKLECEKTGTLLILDEIQSGYGRTGAFFAHQSSGIEPDLITIAKGMGNGYPIGGILINPIIQAKYGMLGTTFGGNHLACAAGLAVLQIMDEENLIVNSYRSGWYLKTKIQTLPFVKRVKGKGLMLGIEFDFPVSELRKVLLEQEFVFTGGCANPKVLRLLPPLSLKHNQIDHFISKLNKALETISKHETLHIS